MFFVRARAMVTRERQMPKYGRKRRQSPNNAVTFGTYRNPGPVPLLRQRFSASDPTKPWRMSVQTSAPRMPSLKPEKALPYVSSELFRYSRRAALAPVRAPRRSLGGRVSFLLEVRPRPLPPSPRNRRSKRGHLHRSRRRKAACRDAKRRNRTYCYWSGTSTLARDAG